MEERQQVVLVRSARSIKAADLLPANPGRASRVHALIDAFQLSSMLKIVGPVPLSKAELTEFHSDEYISHLFSSQPDESLSGSDETDRLEEFGLLYDCPLVDGIEDHVRYVAGGTVTAAMSLVSGETQCAIHWEGGRHHCKRSQASGFCYVNDIVLGILKLQARFARVLYIDLDLHHGDGVQDAFLYSNKVTTLSIHHFDRGFYPNTGGSCDEGRGRGAGHSINVPLRRGATDARFVEVLKRVAGSVAASFKPGAVVVQCGCDGLAGDPHKILNLTADAFVESVRFIMGWNLPVLLLGGGGYNTPDCARCWTRLTALACGRDISSSEDIPEHEFLSEYAPVFDMSIDRRLVDDENTAESIDDIVQQISALTR
ncbi:histone deacetylase 8-like protein [Martensiomyces pterosporus]|nr:histone deacetylase 8-like protein [Martensiomyces pterosporus]